jgi:hypothetical protein
VASNRELSGVLLAIQTPFDVGGRIDEAALTAELEWILDQGVSGLTTGLVSEVLALEGGERRRLAEVVVGVARERGALSVISCGAESAPRVIGVDPIDDNAPAFYRQFGFREIDGDLGSRMFMRLDDAAASFGAQN